MKPFLKWAGGKRWLFKKEFIDRLPPHSRFIEPFLGGGAAFLSVEPSCALIGDINPELINVYLSIRDDPLQIAELLANFQQLHSREFYYHTRSQTYESGPYGAARTLYLNRTCWNGLYRLNLSGRFNVPIGTKSAIFDSSEDFLAASSLLRRADIRTCDFEEILVEAEGGDLIFIDPPYTVKHNVNGFVKYNESIFSWSDQVRLASQVKMAKERGASVVLTNADHQSVRDLYEGIGEVSSVSRASVISGKSEGRVVTSEMLMMA